MVDLPKTMPGHWDTPDGYEVAQQYIGRDRSAIGKGDLSDLHVANAVFLADRNDLDLIVWQTAAKQRIRWLSVQLALAIGREAAMVEALTEARVVFELVEHPSAKDPDHSDRIEQLGEDIGFGALMAGASAVWTEKAAARDIAGSEFVAGPCRATVGKALGMIRDVLKRGSA